MKKLCFFLVAGLFSFGINSFAQTTQTSTTQPHLIIDQTKSSAIDDGAAKIDINQTAPGEGQVRAYTIDEKGNIGEMTIQNVGRRMKITKADFDNLPLEKKQFIIDDQASFIITE